MNSEKKIVIFGWYGTETLGDKAILGGIILDLEKKGYSKDNIIVLSLNVEYTMLTLLDLGYEKIQVKDFFSFRNNNDFINEQDIFIMGGGPLCDIDEMILVLEILENAKKAGKKTCLYACGVGPLNIKKYRYVFKEIVKQSDIINFRDEYTPKKYEKLLLNCDYTVSIDPAFNYIKIMKEEVVKPIISEEYVMFCLREWPEMYSYGIDKTKYNKLLSEYEKQIIELINYFYESGKKVVLFPMHNYYIGDDDREYYIRLCEKYNIWDKVEILGGEYTVLDAINYFKFADFVIAMRFHSVVFSIATQTKFLAIDYQVDKGKVSGVLDHLNIKNSHFGILDFEKNVSLIEKINENLFNWTNIEKIIKRYLNKLPM